MEFNLIPFPQNKIPDLELNRVSVQLDKNKILRVDFILNGNFSGIQKFKIPQFIQKETLTKRMRKKELWKSTCFEFFMKPVGGNEYFEVNVSPELEWNVYSFQSERTGMAEVKSTSNFISVQQSAQDEKFIQSIYLDCDKIQLKAPFAFHACAIIEWNKNVSYWAQTHEGKKPDFHGGWNFEHTVLEHLQ